MPDAPAPATGLADVIHVMRLGRLVATPPEETVTCRDILPEALP